MRSLVNDSPIVWVCSRIRWQLFLTLTFKNPVPSQSVSATMFFTLVRRAAHNSNIHFDRLLWMLRGELGEATARFHYHVLVAGLPPSGCSRGGRFFIKDAWEAIRLNRGRFAGREGDHARVYEFNPTLDGVGYVLKGLDRYAFADEAAAYECSKFGGATMLTLSKSLLRMMEGRNNRILNENRQDDARGSKRLALEGRSQNRAVGVASADETATKDLSWGKQFARVPASDGAGGQVDTSGMCKERTTLGGPSWKRDGAGVWWRDDVRP